MSKAPAFQFYAGDFLVGIMGMSDDEVGIYIKMLAAQWERGSLPSDPREIKKLVHSRKIPSRVVLEKFTVCEDGLLRNARMEKEREKQNSFRESRVDNAKKRWEAGCTSNARASKVHEPSICITDALQSSSSSSDITGRPREGESEDEEPAGFEPPVEKFIAEAARYSVPPGYARQKWEVHSAKGWCIGRTPAKWRKILPLVKRDYVNDGSPPDDGGPAKPIAPVSGPTKIHSKVDVGI